MAHWAFQADPSRYRILAAALDHDETTWTANGYADRIQIGDTALIWLSGPNAGGYALGQITATAKPIAEDSALVPYWSDLGDAQKTVARVRLRFNRRMYLYPLLRKACQEDTVLSQMLIIRQPTGTVFPITDAEFAKVGETLATRRRDWTPAELVSAFALYFDVKSKRIHEPEAAATAKLARLLDRAPAEISALLGHFTNLDPDSKGKGRFGATPIAQEAWEMFGKRPDDARREAERVRRLLLEGGGLGHGRDSSEAGSLLPVSVSLTDDFDKQRKDPTFARQRVEQFLPNSKVREACLTFIADTIERAQVLGPACWGITLRKSKRIHLNVGKYLAVGVYQGKVFLALHKPELSEDVSAFLAECTESSKSFPSLPDSVTYVFLADRLMEIWPKVEKSYWRFVEIAAGTAKQSPWFYSHSSGFVAYAREALNRPSLPDPVYDWSVRRPERPEDEDADDQTGDARIATQGNVLTLVAALDDVRASVARFNSEAEQAKDRARSLLRSTTCWVFDPSTGNFGPNKFAGFAGIDFATYEGASKGGATGAHFDGHTTRTAIETASGMGFSPDPRLAGMMQQWGKALLDPSVFEGLAEGPNKWKFLVLPAPKHRYWRIAPGGKAMFWDENRDSGVIAIGWAQAGDPSSYPTKEELQAHFTKVFNYSKDQALTAVRAVRWFTRDVKPGDIVVANRGQFRVVGRGIVLGPVEYRSERGEFGNCLPIHWFDTEPRDIPKQTSWFTTIVEMNADVYEALFGGVEPNGGDSDPDDVVETPVPRPEPEPLPNIYDYLRARKLHFPVELVTTYLLSLKTKPFVILSGISGTGKTKLAQVVAEWAGTEVCTVNKAQVEITRHEFVSVRPDWLDGKEVLGFYNVLTEEFAMRPFLRLLLRAHRERTRPHFVILDEMNLARVEHYFADLLSATESRTLHEGKLQQEGLHLHDQRRCLPFAKPDGWETPARCSLCKATASEVDSCPLYFGDVQMVPPKLGVPLNVYVTGTVNVDETTHMFSPKVLDRSNVLEFNRVDLDGYGEVTAQTTFMLKEGRIDLGAATVAHQDHYKKGAEEVRTTLSLLNGVLAEYNLHFGYRVANEIALYVQNALEHVGPEAVATALDLQVLQKVLPKFHGSKQKLLRPLWRLFLFTLFGKDLPLLYADAAFDKFLAAIQQRQSVTYPGESAAIEAVMPRSAAKLSRMLVTLRSQGFVSFLE